MENKNGNAALIYILAIFIGLFSPLYFYFFKNDCTEFEKENARMSLNVQICIAILGAVVYVVTFIIPALFPIIYVVALLNLGVNIIGFMAANKGEYPKFPFTFEFIKKS